MDECELDNILKLLTIIEKDLQKILYKKEHTECKSECSKKIELIKRKLDYLQNILVVIG